MMEFVDAFRAASYQWACQKQMFFKIVIPKNFAIYTGKKPSLESLFNSVAGLKARNPIEKGLQRRCFPVNIAKCLGTTFFIEHLWWLLLICLSRRCFYMSTLEDTNIQFH